MFERTQTLNIWFQNPMPMIRRAIRMVRKTARVFAFTCTLTLTLATAAQTQMVGPQINLGLYGGGAWPQDWFDAKDFKQSVAPGWTAGGMIEIGNAIALRGDAQYTWFGKKKAGATLDVRTNVLAATAAVVLDLRSVYLLGGGGWYRFDTKTTTTGQSEKEGYWGANAGAGMPFGIFRHTFIEARIHTVFPEKDEEEGNSTFLTAVLGFRFR